MGEADCGTDFKARENIETLYHDIMTIAFVNK